ncbi:hypothetical protein, partial [Parablautia muri]|uniref:hypothetical protein n=1 Tax=Parablautia muri TaxID=2320879 RepID=UPI00136E46DE
KINGNLKFKIQNISLSSVTIGTNQWGAISGNITIPSGYTFVGILQYSLTSHYAHVFNMGLSGGKATLNVTNLASISITVSGTATVLLIRTEILDN